MRLVVQKLSECSIWVEKQYKSTVCLPQDTFLKLLKSTLHTHLGIIRNKSTVNATQSVNCSPTYEFYIQCTPHCYCNKFLLVYHILDVFTVGTSISLARAIMLSVIYTQGISPPRLRAQHNGQAVISN